MLCRYHYFEQTQKVLIAMNFCAIFFNAVPRCPNVNVIERFPAKTVPRNIASISIPLKKNYLSRLARLPNPTTIPFFVEQSRLFPHMSLVETFSTLCDCTKFYLVFATIV